MSQATATVYNWFGEREREEEEMDGGGREGETEKIHPRDIYITIKRDAG